MFRHSIHIFSVLIILVTISSLVVAVPVAAAQPALNGIGGLVPCGNGNGNQLGTSYSSSNSASTTACDFAGFVDLVKNVTNFLIILSAPIFVGIMVWVGVKLLLARGNREEFTKIKSVLMNTLISFIIILAGWLIVHVIATTFLKTSFNIFQP